MREINGKRILVIGGAGTIGSAFIKSSLVYGPKSVVVVDTNENGLTELVRDIRSEKNVSVPEDFRTYPIDFGDTTFYKLLHAEEKFDIVANFAAHKHVRSEKDIFSIEALIKNNVFKTRSLLEALSLKKPNHFFCVSTDKAANPTNIMGASKKVMEELVLAYQHQFKVTTARFANVAFSNGSLLAGFVERVSKLQPLSTPSDVKRYFVSPQESGQLCLLACVCASNGQIVFPKLSESSMKLFVDIAHEFISAMGYSVKTCSSEAEARDLSMKLKEGSRVYPVYSFKSDTEGEKLFEEFFTSEEYISMNEFSSLGVVIDKKARSLDIVNSFLDRLSALFLKIVEKNTLVKTLQEFIPEFEHVNKGLSLDKKM